MWIPATEQEILTAIAAEDLVETVSFDAKRSLPDGGSKSRDLAKDVAAMASDGGTLLYGVAEDENGRPTIPQPFKLAGARERVDQIVRTSISEPPDIRVREIPTDNDPSVGYLVVAVPPSPRAPHMVTVGKDYRFYGRTDTGNAPLTEGEVARLYERRRRWDVDRDAMLKEAIDAAPIRHQRGYAYLHLVARPVVPDEGLLDRAKGEQHVANFLDGLFASAVSPEVFSHDYAPDMNSSNSYERRADGWGMSQGLGTDWEQFENPGRVLDIEIGLDGTGRLFCGRAGDTYRSNGHFIIFESIVAGLTARFAALLGGLYAAGDYLGPVDAGLAVTGLKGGVSYALDQRLGVHPRPFDRDQYRRTERLSAATLVDDPRGAARKLVMPLVRATTRESYDPFSN